MLAKTTIQQRKALAFASTKGSIEQVTRDEKETWCLSLPSLTPHTIVFLCVSSIHTTLEPSLTSIPSLPISFPPQAILSTQRLPPDKSKCHYTLVRVRVRVSVRVRVRVTVRVRVRVMYGKGYGKG
jgi:hypothetical protein